MPYKPGGGGRPQFYDPDNGEYTDQEKSRLLEEEMKNIVFRYFFRASNTYEPRFPIAGFHSDAYCELYIRFCLPDHSVDLKWEKIEDYLLLPRTINDKSHFFVMHGYNAKDPEALYLAILAGIETDRMEFEGLSEFGIKVSIPTYIHSKREQRRIKIYTIWIYKRDRKLHFVTVDLKRRG